MQINKNLWQFSEAKKPSKADQFILLMLVFAGIICIIRFFDWWFMEEHVGNRFFFVMLSFFFWYSILRLVLIWINYLKISKPSPVKPEEGLTVAIFTTSSPGEPLAMFEKTLEACQKITYPHTTYLLDDTQDPDFKKCAEKHGAVWLNLVGLPGAKAGKVNKALALTNEEFILVLDPDHIPFPEFLDNTLGFFVNEKVGFVQVSQAYYNQYRSFTARAAAEQTYTFYGPTQMGLNGLGCSVAIGSNCTFRRSALESIGGHGIGLAEDLVTSIRIHAAGWKSVYNPVVISRGLVPEELGSFCKQQLKWSRGVFEVTFLELPTLFKKLTGWQKLSYATIGTYYFTGAISFVFTLIPFLFFTTSVVPAKMSFSEFLIFGSPIAFIAVFIYLYVQKCMCHPDSERGIHWRGMILKFACWPVFFLGFLLATVDAEITYIPTAKKAVTGSVTPFAKPLIIHVILFLISIFSVLTHRRFFMLEGDLVLSAERTWGMIVFSLVAFLLSVGGILAAWEAKKLKAEDPWESTDINLINKEK